MIFNAQQEADLPTHQLELERYQKKKTSPQKTQQQPQQEPDVKPKSPTPTPRRSSSFPARTGSLTSPKAPAGEKRPSSAKLIPSPRLSRVRSRGTNNPGSPNNPNKPSSITPKQVANKEQHQQQQPPNDEELIKDLFGMPVQEQKKEQVFPNLTEPSSPSSQKAVEKTKEVEEEERLFDVSPSAAPPKFQTKFAKTSRSSRRTSAPAVAEKTETIRREADDEKLFDVPRGRSAPHGAEDNLFNFPSNSLSASNLSARASRARPREAFVPAAKKDQVFDEGLFDIPAKRDSARNIKDIKGEEEDLFSTSSAKPRGNVSSRGRLRDVSKPGVANTASSSQDASPAKRKKLEEERLFDVPSRSNPASGRRSAPTITSPKGKRDELQEDLFNLPSHAPAIIFTRSASASAGKALATSQTETHPATSATLSQTRRRLSQDVMRESIAKDTVQPQDRKNEDHKLFNLPSPDSHSPAIIFTRSASAKRRSLAASDYTDVNTAKSQTESGAATRRRPPSTETATDTQRKQSTQDDELGLFDLPAPTAPTGKQRVRPSVMIAGAAPRAQIPNFLPRPM